MAIDLVVLRDLLVEAQEELATSKGTISARWRLGLTLRLDNAILDLEADIAQRTTLLEEVGYL